MPSLLPICFCFFLLLSQSTTEEENDPKKTIDPKLSDSSALEKEAESGQNEPQTGLENELQPPEKDSAFEETETQVDTESENDPNTEPNTEADATEENEESQEQNKTPIQNSKYPCSDQQLLLFSPDLSVKFLDNTPTYLIEPSEYYLDPMIRNQRKHQKRRFWAKSELVKVEEIDENEKVLKKYELSDCNWVATCENNIPPQINSTTQGFLDPAVFDITRNQTINFECELENGAFVQVISYMYPNGSGFLPRDEDLLPFSFRFSVMVRNYPFASPKSRIVGKMAASTSSEGLAITAYFFDFGLSGVRIPCYPIEKDLLFHFGKSIVVNEEEVIPGVYIKATAKKVGAPASGQVKLAFPLVPDFCSPNAQIGQVLKDCVLRYDVSLEVIKNTHLSWFVVGQVVTFGILLFLSLICLIYCIAKYYPELSAPEDTNYPSIKKQHQQSSNLNSDTPSRKTPTQSPPLSSVSSFSSSKPSSSLPLRLLMSRRPHKDDPSSLLAQDSYSDNAM